MAIVSPSSIVYSIISGRNKGELCVIHSEGDDGSIRVVLISTLSEEILLVGKELLSQIEEPGWPDETTEPSYGFQEFLKRKGCGMNMLRTRLLAQPRALKTGDHLATGETVTEAPRRGFNSSALVHIHRTGWVELAPRLPVALLFNQKFRLPAELEVGDKLATGCRIVKKALLDAGQLDKYLPR